MSAENPLYVIAYTLLERFCEESKEGVYIDAGANIGGMFQSSRGQDIHAFEPVPDVFKIMEMKHGSKPNVFLNNKALGDKKETVHGVSVYSAWTLLTDEQNKKNMGSAVGYIGKKFDMDVVRLDDYVDEHGLKVAAIKLDVDGYEPMVLRGGKKTIKRDRPIIFFELSEYPCSFGESIDEMLRYIKNELKYVFAANDGSFWTQDIEFVKSVYPFGSSYDITLVPFEKISWIKKC